MFELTVVIHEPIILEAAQKAIAMAFVAPSYNQDRGGPGYEEVRRQVKAYIGTLDLREMIAAQVPEVVRNVTADILATELRKAIKAHVKAMQNEGSLFQDLQETQA